MSAPTVDATGSPSRVRKGQGSQELGVVKIGHDLGPKEPMFGLTSSSSDAVSSSEGHSEEEEAGASESEPTFLGVTLPEASTQSLGRE